MVTCDESNKKAKESKQHDIGMLAASLNAVESVRVRRVYSDRKSVV